MENMINLAAEWAENKKTIDGLTERNRSIAELLDKAATYKEGGMTGKLQAGPWKVTITRRVNTTWDQRKLETARHIMGDETFSKAFTFKFEPRTKAIFDDFLFRCERDEAILIMGAKTDRTGAPGVKIEGE